MVLAMKIIVLLLAVCVSFKRLVTVVVAGCEINEIDLTVLMLTVISGGRRRSYSGPPLARAAQRSCRRVTRLGLYKRRAATKFRTTYLGRAY